MAFTSDVDLTNTDKVKAFFNDNITPFATQQNVPRYAVGTINESTAITQAYSALTGGYAMEPGYESATNLVMALDPSTIDFLDASSAGNHATIGNNTNGGLTTGEDADGKYLEFDGVNTDTDQTYMHLNHSLFRNATSGANEPFTFDIVFKVKEGYAFRDNDYLYIGAGGSSDFSRLYCITSGTNGINYFQFGDTSASYTTTIETNTIQRHTWVYDGVNLTLYINGIEQLSGSNKDFYDMTYFYINSAPGSNASYHNGHIPMKLYGVNIFQKALDASERTALWGQPSGAIAGQTVALSPSAVPVEASGNYQVIMAAQDVTGNVGVGEIITPGYIEQGENLELWLYMTELSSEPNFNLLTGVLIYDKQDGVVVNGTTVTESGNRLSYTIYDISPPPHSTWSSQPSWNVALSSSTAHSFSDSAASNTDPVLKLKNISSDIRSVYLTWYRPAHSFNYKLELRQNGKVMSTYIDDTQSVKLATTGVSINQTFIDNTFGLNVYDQTLFEPSSTFPSLSTLNTSITSAAFDDTGNITLSGEVTASETEGATTTYKALATTQTGLSNTQVRDLINTSAYSEAVVTPGAPEGPYRVLMYMLNYNTSSETDSNAISVVRMYDTHDAYNTVTSTENGNLLAFDIAHNNEYTAQQHYFLQDDTLSTTIGTSSWYSDNLASETEPILIFENVDPSVKSIYIAWNRPKYAFNFKLEILDSSDKVISEFSDETKSDTTGDGNQSTIATLLNSDLTMWNIPDLISTDNITIPKVLDANYQIVDAESVNYANVYLYGTDNVSSAHDDMAVKTIDPAIASGFSDVLSDTVSDYPLDNFAETYTADETGTSSAINDNSVNINITTTTNVYYAYAYDTGIVIDINNSVGVEYWFDFNLISGMNGGYLLPCLMDASSPNITGSWQADMSTMNYCAGNFMMGMSYSGIFNSHQDYITFYNSYSNSPTSANTKAHASIAQAGVFDTHYVIMKVVDTEGYHAGFKEVEYHLYNGPERLESQRIITTRMSRYWTGSSYTTNPPPAKANFVIGIDQSGTKPEITLSNFKTNRAPNLPVTTPHVTLAGASWNNFDNQAVIKAGSTVFSSVAEIDTVYPPVAFTSDVDLTNTDAVKTFFNDNITPLASQPNVPRYAVGTVNESTAITQAYTGLKLLSENEAPELSIRDVDWSAITPNRPAFNLSSIYGAGTVSMIDEYTYFNFDTKGQYGNACAASSDGKTVIISGHASLSSGAAWVWEYDEVSGAWGKSNPDGSFTQGTAHDLSKSGTSGYYGISCALSADGKTALITGYESYTKGCAFVWTFSNGTWTESADISSDGNIVDTHGQYGYSCALSGDGKTALIGSENDDKGSAFFWTYNAGGWTMAYEYKREKHPTIAGNNVNIARSCALSGDGKTAIVGGNGSNDRGAAVILTYQADSETWEIVEEVVKPSGAGGSFGWSSSMSTDGKTAVVAGYKDSTSGCAYVYNYNEATGVWEETTNFNKTSNGKGEYGHGCSVSADGKTILVSSKNSNNDGGAFMFTYNGTSWDEIDLSINHGTVGKYGKACALSADGTTALVVGTYGASSGSAWVWTGIDNGERAALTLSGEVYASAVPVEASGSYQVIMAAQDVTGNVGVGEIPMITVNSFDASVYKSENSSLSYTTITDAIFDREAQTNARYQLGKVVLDNGDIFYGPRQDRSGSSDVIISPTFFVDNNFGATKRMRPSLFISWDLNPHSNHWEFYYEPTQTTDINKCTIYVNLALDSYIHHVYDISLFDGSVLQTVSNPSETLPYQIPEGTYTTADNGISISFDTVKAGPGKPIKLTLSQNNDVFYISEIQFGYDGPTSFPTFPSLSTLNTSITSAAFDDTGNITLSGEVVASNTEGATTVTRRLPPPKPV